MLPGRQRQRSPNKIKSVSYATMDHGPITAHVLIHTNTHTDTHLHPHTPRHIHIQTHIHTHPYTHIHTIPPIHRDTQTHTHTQTHLFEHFVSGLFVSRLSFFPILFLKCSVICTTECVTNLSNSNRSLVEQHKDLENSRLQIGPGPNSSLPPRFSQCSGELF